ncbi:MAG: response regulator [Bacteroidota bacterium]
MYIQLVCNNKDVEQRLHQHFGSRHTITDFDKETGAIEVDAVIIVEPYVIKGQYLSICSIWKNYLLENQPETKLIVAGFNLRDQHSNYLNLLDLHDDYDLAAFIEAAPELSDEWDITHLQNGYDQVINKLRQFFTGHNNESIIDAVAKVRQVLNNAELSLYGSPSLEREIEPFSIIWEKRLYPKRNFFQHFYSRWHYYRDYFNSLPFYPLLKDARIENLIQGLADIFAQKKELSPEEIEVLEEKYRKLDPFNRIGEITDLFRRINSKYIAAESAGTILLIDDDPSFYQQLKEQLHNFTFEYIQDYRRLHDLDGTEEMDLILLDLELVKGEKKYSGLDWIAPLKEMFPKVPLAVVTVHTKELRDLARHTIQEEEANYFLDKSRFDAVKWRNIFVGLLAGNTYTLGDVLIFNQSRNWAAKSNILVVEDEKDWFDRYVELSKEYHFIQANTIQQALDLLARQSFDLIILDLLFKLEGKLVPSGFQLLEPWQKDYASIPLIIVTGDKSIPTATEVTQNGVEIVLYKEDFNAENWLEVIHREIEIKKLMDQRKGRL